jgi:Flp pilus assembly protein TadD
MQSRAFDVSFDLAIALAESGSLAESSALLQELAESKPAAAEILSALGLVLARQERYGEAEMAFGKVQPLRPLSPAERLTLAKCVSAFIATRMSCPPSPAC